MNNSPLNYSKLEYDGTFGSAQRCGSHRFHDISRLALSDQGQSPAAAQPGRWADLVRWGIYLAVVVGQCADVVVAFRETCAHVGVNS
jgi:hypothetical protein